MHESKVPQRKEFSKSLYLLSLKRIFRGFLTLKFRDPYFGIHICAKVTRFYFYTFHTNFAIPILHAYFEQIKKNLNLSYSRSIIKVHSVSQILSLSFF
jgi:hypothetical protein